MFTLRPKQPNDSNSRINKRVKLYIDIKQGAETKYTQISSELHSLQIQFIEQNQDKQLRKMFNHLFQLKTTFPEKCRSKTQEVLRQLDTTYLTPLRIIRSHALFKRSELQAFGKRHPKYNQAMSLMIDIFDNLINIIDRQIATIKNYVTGFDEIIGHLNLEPEHISIARLFCEGNGMHPDDLHTSDAHQLLMDIIPSVDPESSSYDPKAAQDKVEMYRLMKGIQSITLEEPTLMEVEFPDLNPDANNDENTEPNVEQVSKRMRCF